MIKTTFDYNYGDSSPIDLLSFIVDFENVEHLKSDQHE
jgi:hypothetical protein